MKEKNIFSKDELEAMGKRTLDLMLASIENGDLETAKKLGKRMYSEFLAMHDLYRDWVTHLLSLIGRNYGDEVLYEALRETVDGFTQRTSKHYKGKGLREKVELLMVGLRGHLQPLTIEEDEDKFTITTENCGSGGRLIRGGGYDSPSGFLKIKNPQTMTFNRPDFPVYCAHCYFQNISLIEGKPLYNMEPGEELGIKSCRVYIYK